MLDQDEILQKREKFHRMPCVRLVDWWDREWVWICVSVWNWLASTSVPMSARGNRRRAIVGPHVGRRSHPRERLQFWRRKAESLGIEGAHIFQFPKKPKDEGMAGTNDSEFQCAMREISACAEVDPLRKNGTQKTMLLWRMILASRMSLGCWNGRRTRQMSSFTNV